MTQIKMFESVSARGLWAAFTQLQEKRYSLSLMQHHVKLFAHTLCHPPWGLKSPTRRGQRVPGSTPWAAKPSSHLDTKSPHSWVKVSRLCTNRPKSRKSPKAEGTTAPIPFSQSPAAAHYSLQSRLCLQDHLLFTLNGGALGLSGLEGAAKTAQITITHHELSQP